MLNCNVKADLDRCKLENNEDGAVVGMNSSMLTMEDCQLDGNTGAALDLCNISQLYMHAGSITRYAGELPTTTECIASLSWPLQSFTSSQQHIESTVVVFTQAAYGNGTTASLTVNTSE